MLFTRITKILFTSLLILFSITLGKSIAQESQDGVLRIAASQFPVSAEIDSNATWIKKYMKEAKEGGADLIHFSECALSGYAGVDFESNDNYDWEKLHQQTESIMSLADELNLWVLLGSSHRLSDGNKPHNCLYVINPDGEIIDRYDKRFCTKGDLEHYSPGDHFVVFDVNGVSCGLLICYDIRFPELYRKYVEQGVDAVFHSFYNARQKPGGIHPKIMPVTAQARAGSNHVYVSLTNSSTPNSWPCYFITPDGLIVNKQKANEPGILFSNINLKDKYYDASRPFRLDAIKGKLNSGDVVDDEKSKDRTTH